MGCSRVGLTWAVEGVAQSSPYSKSEFPIFVRRLTWTDVRTPVFHIFARGTEGQVTNAHYWPYLKRTYVGT